MSSCLDIHDKASEIWSLLHKTPLDYTDQFGQQHRTYSPPASAPTAPTRKPIPILKKKSLIL